MEYENMTWEFLIEYEYFTEDELRLITNINGYSMETFEDCARARYGVGIEDLCEEQGVYFL